MTTCKCPACGGMVWVAEVILGLDLLPVRLVGVPVCAGCGASHPLA